MSQTYQGTPERQIKLVYSHTSNVYTPTLYSHDTFLMYGVGSYIISTIYCVLTLYKRGQMGAK